MKRSQPPQRYTRRRLLLLLTAGLAGVGISLALSDDAHASDRDTTRLVAGTISAVTDTTRELLPTGQVTPKPAKTTPAKPATSRRDHTTPRKPGKPKPQPVRRAVGHTIDHTVKAPGRTLDKVGRGVDRVARELPPAATKPIEDILDPITGTLPHPELGDLPNLNPLPLAPATPGSAPTAAEAATKTASGPAATVPPRATAGPDAQATHQHPRPAQRDNPPHPAPRKKGHVALPAPLHPDARGHGGGDATGDATPTNTPYGAPTDGPHTPRTTGTPANGDAHAYNGRTQPPSPPSG